jgi:uncharacterized integral membrane protein (TIGR00698 family)
VTAPRIIFLLLALASLTPWVSAAVALLCGIAFAIGIGNPFAALTKKWTSRTLQISVIGLGAGMNLETVMRAGAQGALYTVIGVGLTLLLGLALGAVLRNEREVSLLVSCGTAICGGSAIAAVASSIGADEEDVSVSLVTVFFLNSVALFLFPWLGHQLQLDQRQFGFWSALAIHDTSSVVGAALQYGPQSLELATIIKLTRAVWIVPLALGIGLLWRHQPGKARKQKYPWFILGFVAVAGLVTWVPGLQAAGQLVQTGAKHLLVLTLFLIGSNVPRSSWSNPEVKRTMIQGLLLWLIVATGNLAAIRGGWIRA